MRIVNTTSFFIFCYIAFSVMSLKSIKNAMYFSIEKDIKYEYFSIEKDIKYENYSIEKYVFLWYDGNQIRVGLE